MSNKRRSTQRTQEQANPGPLRLGYMWHRNPVGWVLTEVAIPQDVVDKYTTRKHEPDVIGMVSVRVQQGIERSADGFSR